MIYNLSTKTILITGANSGIGKAASIQLAGMGAHVVMMCRNRERGEQALQDVTGAHWDALNTPVKANKNAYNRETQQRLWNSTKQFIAE